MTIGVNLLRKILQTQDKSTFRILTRELFTQSELAFFDFVQKYSIDYGNLPSTSEAINLGYININDPSADSETEFYIDRIKERHVFNLARAGTEKIVNALKAKNVEEIKSIIPALSSSIAKTENVESIFTFSEAAQKVLQRVNSGVSLSSRAVFSGWPSLDAKTLGLLPGDVETIVGRPGQGKSYMILHRALTAMLEGKKVLLVSMEMTVEQMTSRLLSMYAQINPNAIRTGEVDVYSKDMLNQAVLNLANLPTLYMLEGRIH